MHYLDNAATAPILPEVRDTMLPFLEEAWGNPSSIHEPGRRARAGVDDAREKFASAIGCSPEEIVFTGSGTEAGNLAMKGAAWAVRDRQPRRNRIHLPKLEHHAVLDSATWLGSQGFEVDFLPVEPTGLVDPAAVAEHVDDTSVLVALMLVNNEIGTIEPLAEVSAVCRDAGALLYTDAVQALGKIPLDVSGLGVDMAGLSAHKIGGPKGVGALYVKRGVKLTPTLHGGGQERGRRSGTENVAGIAGFGAAAEVVVTELDVQAPRWRAMRDRLWDGLSDAISDIRLNGHPQRRVPHNLHVSVRGVVGEDVLLMLDAESICASTGSACQSGSVEPSYVLAACGVPREWATGALRFTFGRGNTDEDVDAVLDVLPRVVDRLRSFSRAR